MLDCNKTITHVFKTYNEETRQYDLNSEVLENCSWFKSNNQSFSKGVYHEGDIVKVRIPLHVRSRKPLIKKGDIMILGKVDIKGLSEGMIRNKYDDSFEVSKVTYNENSRPYSRHIKVES